jgi:hypothetical protein
VATFVANGRVCQCANKNCFTRGFTPEMRVEVDYQVAAPAEMRTPNLHRAKIAQPKSADGRMATEAARLKCKTSYREEKEKPT